MKHILFTLIVLSACTTTKKKPLELVRCEVGIDTTQTEATMSVNRAFAAAVPPKEFYTAPFILESAGNKNVVLLEFTGYKLIRTNWNYNYGLKDTVNLDASGFTTSQQRQIIDTVKKLFKPFNVLITNSKLYYNKAGLYSRQRVVVTKSYEGFGNQAGGLTFVGSFQYGSEDVPSLVFSSLLKYNVSNTARAIAHEIGHSFGLQHQADWGDNCVIRTQFRAGAIMGWFYGNTTWVTGPTMYNCTDIQNDTLIIKTILR
jgi:hypothetical protein